MTRVSEHWPAGILNSTYGRHRPHRDRCALQNVGHLGPSRDQDATSGDRERPRALHGRCPAAATPGLDVTQIFGKVGVQVKIVSFHAHYVPGDNMGALTGGAADHLPR
jgi:hypothetical protein